MRGLMMDTPLLISSLVEHAATVFPGTEVVTRTVEGPVHRYAWPDVRRRSMQVARALRAAGVRDGDTVATIAWNTHRHLELYYGVSGTGAVIHTVNPRLHPSQVAYVLNHARDRMVFVDLTFVPLAEAVWEHLTSVKTLVVLTDRAHMPDTKIPGALCYEEWIAAHDGDYAWPVLDENAAAAICYTSGTTGNPKGVVYSHRSTVLHAMGLATPGGIPVGADGALLPVVPMFHVMAWGIPYCAAICGYKLVLPGPRMDGAGLTELMNQEAVTYYAGVPTVHLGLLEHWRESGASVPSLQAITTGGAAPTRTMIEGFHERGIQVVHGWGMTETSPVGSLSKLSGRDGDLDPDEKVRVLMRQGRPPFGVELRVVDGAGRPLPHDGKTTGELQIRGPWVASAYLGEEPGSALDAEGWFSTGDVASIDGTGTTQITDRKKDLIKSGGEWISSLDLEDMAMRHPEIAMAAVIGVPHEKWGERPLLIAVPAPGGAPTRESVLEFLEGQVAKWWLPDEVVFVDALPMGGTGKVQKTLLREQYGGGGAAPAEQHGTRG
ncbi:MAG TPA: long-chain-fatty-acid--CoA ligase [Longimicrobiales bacterium]|nr:long-chain-fatty-acid--CoA ligase [Longimicrobiales bacterium]